MNQVPTSADGCKALSCTSIQSCLLVARALLRSEPFSTWNLRITFFEEYCWAAWIRLEHDLSNEVSRRLNVDVYREVGLHNRKSRLGRHLPPNHLTPSPICDFTGVDGNRKSLLDLSEAERSALKLEAKASKAVQEGRSPGKWPEKLPRTLSVRAMGGTWDNLKKAPLAPSPIKQAFDGASIARDQLHRVRLNDDDQAELSWQRYTTILEHAGLSIEAVQPTSNELSTQRCILCQSAISLQQHLTYTTCPAPFRQLQPQSYLQDSPTLSQFGFLGNKYVQTESTSSTSNLTSSHCQNLFHIACLARHFVTQQSNIETKFVLPTHGSCPSCGKEGKEEDMNTWIEVIRGVYRRKERLESEIAKAKVARLREEKLQLKNGKKKRNIKASNAQETTTTSAMPDTEMNVEDAPICLSSSKKGSLIDALDQIQSMPRGKRSFQPVSTLLRDPIHPPSRSTTSLAQPPSSVTTNKQSSLLCSLDGILNAPQQRGPQAARIDAKRAKSTARQTSNGEVIDLT